MTTMLFIGTFGNRRYALLANPRVGTFGTRDQSPWPRPEEEVVVSGAES